MCKFGWIGIFCDMDINECNNIESLCKIIYEECINFEGFFRCDCEGGYEWILIGSCKG